MDTIKDVVGVLAFSVMVFFGIMLAMRKVDASMKERVYVALGGTALVLVFAGYQVLFNRDAPNSVAASATPSNEDITLQAVPPAQAVEGGETQTQNSGNTRQDWLNATPQSRRAEVARILRNCTTKFSVDYYVGQLDDFYAGPATVGVKVHEAMVLISAAVDDLWECS